MRDLTLEESEARLLSAIDNPNSSDLLYLEHTLDYTVLENCLRITSNLKILETFANNFFQNKGIADPYLAEDIAANRNTPEEILDRLAKEEGYIGGAVARNTSTSTKTLLEIWELSTSRNMVSYAGSQLRHRKEV